MLERLLRGPCGRLGLLELRLDRVESGPLPLRDRLHRLGADGAGVARREAAPEGESGVLAVRLLSLGSPGALGFSCVGLGLLQSREGLLLLGDGASRVVVVPSLVSDGLRGPPEGLIEGDELLGPRLFGQEDRVAGLVEDVRVLLRREPLDLGVQCLSRLAGIVQGGLGGGQALASTSWSFARLVCSFLWARACWARVAASARD